MIVLVDTGWVSLKPVWENGATGVEAVVKPVLVVAAQTCSCILCVLGAVICVLRC